MKRMRRFRPGRWSACATAVGPGEQVFCLYCANMPAKRKYISLFTSGLCPALCLCWGPASLPMRRPAVVSHDPSCTASPCPAGTALAGINSAWRSRTAKCLLLKLKNGMEKTMFAKHASRLRNVSDSEGYASAPLQSTHRQGQAARTGKHAHNVHAS